MNTQEKLQQFGLDWSVVKRPLVCSETGQETNSYGLFRSDNNKHLGTVGRIYTPYQNSSMISLVSQASQELGLEVSRGGSFQGGKKVFTQVELDPHRIGNSDTKRFITIVNSHDGTYQVGVGMTNIVVICQNQFNKMFNGGLSKIRHNRDVEMNVDDMIKKITHGIEMEALVLDSMQTMADTAASRSIFEQVVMEVFAPVSESASPDGKMRAEARREKGIETLTNCIKQDVGIHGNTLWGLFNGVTRFYTHHRGGTTDEKRMNFNMNGNGSRVVNNVFNLLTF